VSASFLPAASKTAHHDRLPPDEARRPVRQLGSRNRPSSVVALGEANVGVKSSSETPGNDDQRLLGELINEARDVTEQPRGTGRAMPCSASRLLPV
jgi:hypothetical protein